MLVFEVTNVINKGTKNNVISILGELGRNVKDMYPKMYEKMQISSKTTKNNKKF